MPVLFEHDSREVVGYTDSVEIGASIKVSGIITSGETGQMVARLADEGFPWQMSVRIYPESIFVLNKGEQALVNGQVVEGPISIFKDSFIREVSFCALGADRNTNANIYNLEGKRMDVKNPSAPLDRDLALQALTDDRNQFKATVEELKSKQTQFIADNAALKGQLQAVEFENKSLKDSLVAARSEADSFREKFQALSQTSRKAILIEDFQKLGVEFKEDDEAIKAILGADEAVFQAFRKTMENLRVPMKPPAGAFDSTTVPTDFTAGPASKSIVQMATEKAGKEKING
jgi:hypothetical protein